MRRFAWRAACAFLIVCPAASWASAQGLERAPTPIEVRVSAPSAAPRPAGQVPRANEVLVVPTGTTVRIHGTSVRFGDGPAAAQVKVAVRPPAGAPATLTATLAADLSWSTTFSATAAAGVYTVTATAPDGRATATVRFTAGTPADIVATVDALVQSLERTASDVRAGLAASRASLDAKGPFPNQETVNRNLERVDAAMAEVPARMAGVRRALARLADVAGQYPAGASELEPATTAIADATRESESTGERLRAVTENVRRDSGTCDRLDAVNELLAATSLFFDLKGRLFTKVIQLAGDKFLPDRIYNAAVPPANRSPEQKFALGELIKSVGSMLSESIDAPATGLGRGMRNFLTEPQNLLLDTAQFVGGLVFDHFCEKFTGPFTGTFSVDALVSAGGAKFWGYTVKFGGTLTVRYEKRNPRPGEAVAVTGEFEGNGAFTMYEDLMALNPFNRRFVLFRHLFPPIGFSGTAQELVNPLGKVARMLTPAYFRIPITGAVAADRLTIKVGATALNDFTDLVRGNALYVTLPPASPIPYTMIAKIPVQKGQFIISRGLRNEVTLPVTTTGQGRSMIKSVAQAFDRRETVANGEITVIWHIDLKACNPECGG